MTGTRRATERPVSPTPDCAQIAATLVVWMGGVAVPMDRVRGDLAGVAREFGAPRINADMGCDSDGPRTTFASVDLDWLAPT